MLDQLNPKQTVDIFLVPVLFVLKISVHYLASLDRQCAFARLSVGVVS